VWKFIIALKRVRKSFQTNYTIQTWLIFYSNWILCVYNYTILSSLTIIIYICKFVRSKELFFGIFNRIYRLRIKIKIVLMLRIWNRTKNLVVSCICRFIIGLVGFLSCQSGLHNSNLVETEKAAITGRNQILVVLNWFGCNRNSGVFVDK
jgi:hypothetical protein